MHIYLSYTHIITTCFTLFKLKTICENVNDNSLYILYYGTFDPKMIHYVLVHYGNGTLSPTFQNNM